MTLKAALEPGFVLQIGLDEVGAGRYELTTAGDQVVEDGDLVAGREQDPRDVTADEAGAAGDEDLHAMIV